MITEHEIRWVNHLYSREYRASLRGAVIAVIAWTEDQCAQGVCDLQNLISGEIIQFEGITMRRGLEYDERCTAQHYVWDNICEFLAVPEKVERRAFKRTRRRAESESKFNPAQFDGYQPEPSPLRDLSYLDDVKPAQRKFGFLDGLTGKGDGLEYLDAL